MTVSNRDLQKRERLLVPLEKGKSGDVHVVVAYPNRYWLAMSNLGFQTVYKLFSQIPRFKTERAYLPEGEKEPIRSFESTTTLSKADILALSVSFETDYPSVLCMLEAAGIDISSRQEGDGGFQERSGKFRPLVVGGGAALTLNPEPLANFFDAIVIGEGEEVINEIAQIYLRSKDERVDFKTLLLRLAELEGVYVPSFYRAHYNPDGTIEAFSARFGLTPRVTRRIVQDIDNFPTYTTIQTSETEFKSMFMTETGRGCEVGCRFCVAGYMYRPTRKRKADTIYETVQIGLRNSDSIGFVGAAVSSHPKIAELASSVAQTGKRASLSSIMSQKVSPELAASLSESEYKTVALAPEAGSERLRFAVGKRVCNEQVLSGISLLAEGGIRNFKLYFIVGLPSEEAEDVKAIVDLVREAQRAAITAARRMKDFSITPRIVLSVNPFIPKAWTPFQRHAFLGFAELKRRLLIVRRGVEKIPNVQMKNESPRESYFQAFMSRGDRRVGDLLVHLHKNGLDWRTLVQNGNEVLVDGVPPSDFYVLRTFVEDEILPWEIVDLQIKRSLLEREYRRTFKEDVKPLIARAKREFEASNYPNRLGESGRGISNPEEGMVETYEAAQVL